MITIETSPGAQLGPNSTGATYHRWWCDCGMRGVWLAHRSQAARNGRRHSEACRSATTHPDGMHRYAEVLPASFIDEPCKTCSYVGPDVDAQGRCETCRVVKNENAPRQHAPTQLDHELAAAVMAAPRSNK